MKGSKLFSSAVSPPGIIIDPGGPLATYQARVKANQLVEDKHQLAAVTKLQGTFNSIVGYEPASPSLISKWLGLGRSKEAPKVPKSTFSLSKCTKFSYFNRVCTFMELLVVVKRC